MKQSSLTKALLVSVAPMLILTGCNNDNNDSDNGQNDDSYTLQLLHFADVDGTGGLSDVRNFAAMANGFRGEMPERTLLVSSGDNLIPGPEFYAAGEDSMADVLGTPGNGRANIAWLNEMGVQASVIGNHDLDAGTDAFSELIAGDGDWPGADFPYLGANIDYSGDAASGLVVENGGAAQANSIAGSVTVTVNGERIGLVGASVPTLPSITSTGALTLFPESFSSNEAGDLDALAGEIQPAVDELTSDGVDKIILLAHMQQIAIEQALAERLEDVDIIVAGGSNTLLADANDSLREGDEAQGDYPQTFTSPKDEPVLLVNTAGDFRYLGRLVVDFNDQGVIQEDSLEPAENGAWATDELPRPFESVDGVNEVADALEEVLIEKDGNVLGLTETFLDGRRGMVRTRETNLGNLTADANLWVARQAQADVDVSLKNGGGIRAPIGRIEQAGSNSPDDAELLPPAANDTVGKPEGGVSQLDAETALRFNNGLTLLTVTAAELADIVEHSVAATEDGATPGQFPQIAGMRFEFDPSQAPRDAGDTNQADPGINGDRLRKLEILNKDGSVADTVVENGSVQGSASREFRMVILDFIAKCVDAANTDCGDGYPLNGLNAPDRADLTTDPGQADFADPGSEQDAFAEYMKHAHGDEANAFNQPVDVNNRIIRVE